MSWPCYTSFSVTPSGLVALLHSPGAFTPGYILSALRACRWRPFRAARRVYKQSQVACINRKTGTTEYLARPLTATKSEIRISKSEIRISKSEIRISKFEIRISKSEIRISKSEIRISKSEIRNNFKWQKTQCSKLYVSLVWSTPYGCAFWKTSIKNKKLIL